MRRVAACTLGLLCFFGAYASVRAQTIDELKAMIALLTQQIAAIEQQIAARGGTPISGGSAACPALTRALYAGLSGEDVKSLQRFLAADSSIYPEGLATGYFGPATERAVQRWQARNNIVSSGTPSGTGYGVVGPGTRAAIARVCGNTSTTPTTPTVRGCTVGSTAMQHGETRTFYTASSLPTGGQCFGLPRTCMNGVISGEVAYVYPTCTVQGRTCTMDGTVIAHGETRTMYLTRSVAFGASCQGSPRTCTDGTLTGSTAYGFASCAAPTTGRSCTVDGASIAHGDSPTLYKQKTVLFGQTCDPFKRVRTCTDGSLTGDSAYQYISCSIEGARSCEVVASSATTTVVAHAGQRDFYSTDTVPYTNLCSDYKQTRICTDGLISGSATYKYPTCKAIPARTCTLDNVTVAHNSTHTFYVNRSVSASGNCNTTANSQARTCTDGTLSGSATFQYSVCAKTGQRWCLLDGKYTAHNAASTYYSTQQVPFGNSCTQFADERSCSDGTLNGSATYQYASCSSVAAASCTLNGKTTAHGSSTPFYSVSSAPSGETCTAYQQIRFCNDGTYSGSASFSNPTCTN
ncbi:MAG: peptidoglycan-binding protein [Parcubacteria group bacterium]|nr:peptidoglycan-binding protein [Parcubacteria group bacterium]